MAKFLRDDELNAELTKLFREANDSILLISPYIKLHDRIKYALELKRHIPEIALIIVFGKNEDNIEKSMSKEDFEFFKSFPNVQIFYNNRLHAKYYASEKSAILTSMNLHSYSQNNNIEFGILLSSSKINDFTKSIFSDGSLDSQAYNYFIEVLDQSILLYDNEPIVETSFLGLATKYIRSEVKTDETEKYYKGERDFKNQTSTGRWRSHAHPASENKTTNGYCIRTGVSIPFNLKRPLCDDAFQSWSKYSNPDYPEKFCHFSGEKSNGETSFKMPILKKNWSKAKEMHKF
jgi:hypothetical protein